LVVRDEEQFLESVPELQAEVLEMLGLPCFDVCAWTKSVTSTCQQSYAPGHVFNHDLGGKVSWVHVPPDNIKEVLDHYLWCKAKKPSTTSACFLLPTTMGQNTPWLSRLKGMELLKQYGSGDRILHNPSTGEKVLRHKQMEVWYDPPSQVLTEVEDKVLTLISREGKGLFCSETKTPKSKRRRTHKMLFRGHCNGKAATVLMDSGATANYATKQVCIRAGVTIVPSGDSSTVAGELEIPIRGEARIPITIGAYKAEIQFLVVDKILEGTDIVLGEEWFDQEQVDISYYRYLLYLHKSKRTLYPLGRKENLSLFSHQEHTYRSRKQLSAEVDNEIMGYKQAWKALKHGAEYLVLNVRKSQPSSEESSPSPLSGTNRGTLSTIRAKEGDSHSDLPSLGMLLRGDISAEVNEEYVAAQRALRENRKQASLLVSESRRYQQPIDSPGQADKDKETPQEQGIVPTFREMVEKVVHQDPTTPGLIDKDKLVHLIQEYEEVFMEIPDGLPPDRNIGHTIRLEQEAIPPYRRNRRMSPAELEICEEYVGNLLKKGWITPSSSPFGAPIMFVAKPAGGFRVVCDWRALNKLTIKNRYPIPRIDETLDKLSGATIFSSLDLNSGYFQIRISDEDAHKTAFTTPMGQYEFKVLGQGLVNSPATFQAVMNRIFKDQINRKCLVVYLDDIMIFGKDPEEHYQHLREVLEILKKERFFAKISKCAFNQPEVQFLGHLVGREGIKVNPKKVEVVKNWPVPKDVKELRQFLGLTNYFRRFIQGYSSLTAPMMNLVKKGVDFQKAWQPEHQEIFEQLKDALTTAPILVLPDFSKPFEVVSDASLYGTGAILFQEGRVVGYTSKKFSGAEVNYSTTEQELLGVVNAMKEWRCYLEGAEEVTLVTDHNPLQYLTDKQDLTRRLARWMEFLSPYKFKWEYRKGRHNVADPISRNPALISSEVEEIAAVLLAWTIPGIPPQQDFMAKIKKGYKEDPEMSKPKAQKYLLRDGFYFKEDKIVVPKVGNLRTDIIDMCHSPAYAGHGGRDKTLELIKRSFYWSGMDKDTAEFVKSCYQCQTNKSSNQRKAGALQPLEVPDHIWECVTVDFITGLPPSQSGYDSVVVFVDKLSKMVKMEPCSKDLDAPGFAKLFMATVVRQHGWPSKVVSDRDSKFTGNFWKEVAKSLLMDQAMSTAFHPETDGQTERMNRVIEETLRNYVNPYHDDWDQYLYMAEFAINNSKQESTKQTPFYLVYGHHPHTPVTLTTRQFTDRVPAAQRFLQNYADRTQHAKDCIRLAQERQKKQADKSRRPVSYKVGDMVLLSTRNLKFKAKAVPKFAPKWVGPYEILTVVAARSLDNKPLAETTTVRLKLPPLMKVHPVFHVSLIKPYHEGIKPRPLQPLVFDEDGSPKWEVECIMQERVHRQKQTNGKTIDIAEYLLRWKGFGPDQDTWVAEEDIVDTAFLKSWKARNPATAKRRKQVSFSDTFLGGEDFPSLDETPSAEDG